MIASIQMRPALPADTPEFAKLMNAQYARQKSARYFQWQYFESAYPALLMGAFASNELIGMFGLQQRQLQNGALIGQALDMLVASDYRGKGIFADLARKSLGYFSKWEACVVFPNPNGRRACERLGWKTLGRMNIMKWSAGVTCPMESLNLKADRQPQTLNRFIYTDAIRHWRFDRNPEYTYQRIQFDQASVWVKEFTDPITLDRFGDIVDIEAPSPNALDIPKVIEKACAHIIASGVPCVTTWALPHTPLYQLLKQMGFLEAEQDRYFCMQLINPASQRLSRLENWHLVQADAEIY